METCCDGFPCLLWGPVWGWVAGDDMWMISHGGLVQGSVAAKCSIALESVAAICSLRGSCVCLLLPWLQVEMLALDH
uniref:Uncharacterized protein n=1 Tax=Populus trichocarpa TaxID=3694 RepID=A0A3N7F9I3_POPTR